MAETGGTRAAWSLLTVSEWRAIVRRSALQAAGRDSVTDAALRAILDAAATPPVEPGDYCEETDPGIVTFFRKDGTPFLHMPTSVYLQLKESVR